MMVVYEYDPALSPEMFIDILQRSTLAERRPIENPVCIEGMISNADITVVAKEGEKIIGIARSVTDFSYCCYLSDLAVDEAYQGRGIGKELIKKTKEKVLPSCKIILLSAPKAVDYYPAVGFEKHGAAFVLQ